MFIIVTDLIFSYYKTNKNRGIKRLYADLCNRLFFWGCGLADGQILLTQQMNDVINTHRVPSIIIEGLVEIDNYEKKPMPNEFRRIIMYAGGIYEKYGVKDLLSAFIMANFENNIELNFYGYGDYIGEIRKAEKDHSNIKYCGMKPNKEILRKEKEATLLVNPRKAEHDFTRYSFPSKNLEYLTSGTPLLASMLPGIPDEYCSYIYTLNSNSVEDLCQSLKKILSKSDEELIDFGLRAKKYVVENKNYIVQVNKIYNFIDMVCSCNK